MTLIKDLIDIPDRVQKGDFVLRLAEDIHRPEVVLENYVVTPELRVCYDAALSFIGNAVRGRTSKATYLHGSFGSGKSHFMAVLHLILQGNAAARGIPELAAVIQKHNHPKFNFDGLRMGDYFEGFANDEARNLGKTLAEIKAWTPLKKVAKERTTKTMIKSKQKTDKVDS